MNLPISKVFLTICLLAIVLPISAASPNDAQDYHRARWDKIHFQPDISKATNKQCLNCHQEILESRPRAVSPAGVKSTETKAWYQTLNTYTGEQERFHRRHLTSPFAKSVMSMKCTTCHQGNDPRDETSATSKTAQAGLTMRKMTDPFICAMCHGQFNSAKMGVPGPWPEHSSSFNDSCLTCHIGIKTERHKNIGFLKAKEIEVIGKKDSDACYGCHGGRSWYRISFPYSEKRWPGWGQPPAGAEKKYPKMPDHQAHM